MTHSIGPWNTFNEFDNRGGCFAADGITLVSHLRDALPGDTHRTPPEDEIRSNFRLIDVAPELLQLAKDVCALSGRWGEQAPLVAKARELVERAERP